MTTPERLRRRQYIIEWLAVIAILLAMLNVVYTNLQNRNQADCLAAYAKHNAEVQQLRAELGDKNAMSVDTFLLGVVELIVHPSNDPQADQTRFQRLSITFAAQQRQLASDRSAHPVPDFPDGCN